MNQLLSAATVKTRKPHKCSGCLEVIQSGTEVELQVVKNNDGIANVYICSRCQEWIENHNWNEHFDEDGCPEGGIKEEMKGCCCEFCRGRVEG